MELSIIILNYKSRGLVKNCLKSVLESEIDFPHEIIVVDNNSDDGVENLLKENFPQVKLFKMEKNVGMGAGNNIGIKNASGRHILILNPDIFLFADTIKKIYHYVKDRSDVGLVGPRLLNPDRTLQHTCYAFHKFWTPLFRRTPLGRFSFAENELNRFLMTDWDHNTNRPVDWIQGSCVLIPKKVLDEVGLFDERFFMYFEDTDLCRRIINAGYKNIYLADSEAIHFHGRQSAEGGYFKFLFNKLTRIHIISWIKYMVKWKGQNRAK
ncbi:MAG: glycosyltransferase family 2 protein [Parcubacteria group bacterium]